MASIQLVAISIDSDIAGNNVNCLSQRDIIVKINNTNVFILDSMF
jgi:hypothetical protein